MGFYWHLASCPTYQNDDCIKSEYVLTLIQQIKSYMFENVGHDSFKTQWLSSKTDF